MLETISIQETKNPLVCDTIQNILYLLSEGNKIEFCWIPSHIGIAGNEIADTAAKASLTDLESNIFKVPYTDKFYQVKQYVNSCWQQYWNENNQQKLYQIMPVIGEFNVCSLSRREQVVIHRIRIGHTRLTHSFLMEGRRDVPQCEFCDEELTVKHFMLNCRHYSTIRRRFYSVTSMKALFDTVSLRRIISFLKESGLFRLI